MSTPRANGARRSETQLWRVWQAHWRIAARVGATRRSSGSARTIVLRALLTSYLVAGMVLASLVTVLDHHGAERNPNHSHVASLGEAAVEHSHAFEGFHLHRALDTHVHHGEEPALAGADLPSGIQASARTDAASSAYAYIASISATLPAAIGIFSAGWLMPFLTLAAMAVLTWPTRLWITTSRHQVSFAPPLRPPALHTR